MRIACVIHAAVAATVIGSGSLWAADTPAPAPAPAAAPTAAYAAPAVNARRALGENISELNVDGVALSRVMDFLRQTSGANIVVNWKILEAAGISKDTPVTLQVRDLTLRKMIRLVLDQVSPSTQLTCSVDSNVLQITTQDEADKVLITKVYVVDDLVMTDNRSVTPPTFDLNSVTKGGTTSGGGGANSGNTSLFTQTNNNGNSAASTDTPQKRGEDLVSLVRDVVRPTIWKENGGPASIRYFSGKLIVSAPASVHEAIGGPMLPEGGQRIGM